MQRFKPANKIVKKIGAGSSRSRQVACCIDAVEITAGRLRRRNDPI